MLTQEENELITRTDAGTPMGEVFRSFWLPALLASELPAPDCPPVRVRLLGEDLVAFRDSEGKVGLVDAHCPHRRADLFFGRNEEAGLRCVYHGWKFDVAGNCVDMPNEPVESNFKGKITTTAYPCVDQGGIIWAYMGPKEWQPELPQLEWSLVPESHHYIDKYEVQSNYLQAVEGDIDNSHVSFLHSYMTLDARRRARPASLNQANQAIVMQDKTPKVILRDTDYGEMIGWRRDADPERYYWRITHWLMPAYSIVGAPEPGQTYTCNVRVPIDDEHSWFYRVRTNPERPLSSQEVEAFRSSGVVNAPTIPGTFKTVENRENDYLIDRQLQRSYSYTGIKSIPQQDRAVSEMDPIIDRTKEHLGTSDTAIIGMRRLLLLAAADVQQGRRPDAARHGAAYRVRSCGAILEREVPFHQGAKELFTVRA